MHQLNTVLAKNKLALENQGSIAQQSIAGAFSTGTHGSGIDFGIVGTQVYEITFIKADGTKQTVNKEKDEGLFKACVVNLGCLGVISEVTLQVVEAFNLHDYTTTLPFDEVIENIKDYINQNDYFKLWWMPPHR